MALLRGMALFAVMAALLAAVGVFQSWSVSLSILNLCLISAIMALGLNMQWGYAGLFNAGVMGFVAVGGLAAVLVSTPPVAQAWQEGGLGLVLAGLTLAATAWLAIRIARLAPSGVLRVLLVLVVIGPGYALIRYFYDPATAAIESVDAASAGFLGGLGLPIMFSWLVGGVFAAAAAWLVGRIALGLRSDYFAIATLGIAEIIIAILKNEDWLARGVKNVTGLDRPVPFEVDLQNAPWFIAMIERLHQETLQRLSEPERIEQLRLMVIDGSAIVVKLAYAGLFLLALLILLWVAQRLLNSPWGRMMRAIRDNETSANAMGKDVVFRHRQVFILGAAVLGIAGAMLTTLDGQFTPTSYQPLRFTFLVWVMVIVGGSGNNFGAVLGGFVVWFVWVQAEPFGFWLGNEVTAVLPEGSALADHLLDGAPHLRLVLMGVILLLALRFAPRGLLPERVNQR